MGDDEEIERLVLQMEDLDRRLRTLLEDGGRFRSHEAAFRVAISSYLEIGANWLSAPGEGPPSERFLGTEIRQGFIVRLREARLGASTGRQRWAYSVVHAFDAARRASYEIDRWLAAGGVVTLSKALPGGPGTLAERLRRIRRRQTLVGDLWPVADRALQPFASDDSDAEVIAGDPYLSELFGLKGALGDSWRPVAARWLYCAGPIVGKDAPKVLHDRLLTLKRCYALALYDAARAFCRVVIDCGAHARLAADDRSVPDPKPKWIDLRRLLSRHVTIHPEVNRVRRAANSILHPGDSAAPMERDCFRSIQVTFEFVELLFPAR